MKVAEIRTEAELESMRCAWNRLLPESASQTIFLTWEWAATWWAAYGKPGDLRLLMFLDESGTLRGIAPLRRQIVKRYGLPVPVLSFIGDSSIDAPGLNDSDYLDFIFWRGYEKQIIEAFHRYMAELDPAAVLWLNEIPESSPNLPLLRETAGAHRKVWIETDVACATARWPENWDEFLSGLQPRFRTKIRSTLRNLENRPEVQFRFCDNPEQLDRVLPALFDLHTRRWAEEGKPGVFGWDRKRDFYRRVSPRLLERSSLRLSWLEWNGRILACQYGFIYAGTYFQLQEGYEPSSEHWNPGIGLRAWSIRELLKEGVREYDFLGGVGRHKSSWGAEVKNSKRILFARKSWQNLLFCRSPEWEANAREWIRRAVPERVLTARRSLLNRQSSKGQSPNTVGRAVAGCYFHLGFAAAVRPLRERYQLSIARNGTFPKASLQRRKGPSARILYYHRVNDEKDPFFEAISTDLFEQQMRHLRRHYRVVSLAEALRRLQDGEARQPVVAVTFDDGYRDNYENALPILRRYGLPATIFLTTGSLDSGEAMWFERLAEAVKTTRQEYLDLEIGVPRRCWLRTLAERLAANGQIFSILRSLPQQERHARLEEILRRLGSPQPSARDQRMLSWDQVRRMKAEGIDFGGHTVTHPILSKLSPAQVAWEVGECKRRIERELQQQVDYFAYPNGKQKDFNGATKDAIANAGYRAALTTVWGLNVPSTDRLELRRGGPWEETVAQFAYKLDLYQLTNE